MKKKPGTYKSFVLSETSLDVKDKKLTRDRLESMVKSIRTKKTEQTLKFCVGRKIYTEAEIFMLLKKVRQTEEK